VREYIPGAQVSDCPHLVLSLALPFLYPRVATVARSVPVDKSVREYISDAQISEWRSLSSVPSATISIASRGYSSEECACGLECEGVHL
jgi:hypothetical protein